MTKPFEALASRSVADLIRRPNDQSIHEIYPPHVGPCAVTLYTRAKLLRKVGELRYPPVEEDIWIKFRFPSIGR